MAHQKTARFIQCKIIQKMAPKRTRNSYQKIAKAPAYFPSSVIRAVQRATTDSYRQLSQKIKESIIKLQKVLAKVRLRFNVIKNLKRRRGGSTLGKSPRGDLQSYLKTLNHRVITMGKRLRRSDPGKSRREAYMKKEAASW